MSERDPKAEAAILARKARNDAAAMRELAGNREISDEIVGFHVDHGVEPGGGRAGDRGLGTRIGAWLGGDDAALLGGAEDEI